MTLTPAQAVAQVDSPRHDWDELSDHYKRHCREIAAAAIAAHKVLEADVPLAPPEWMPPAPSFHAERDGTLGEVEVGDRFMWAGTWHAATDVVDLIGKSWWVRCDDNMVVADRASFPVRIQKRAATEGPAAEMRLPGGDVAYQTVRAGEVVAGVWVDVDEHDEWRMVRRSWMGTDPITLRHMVSLAFDDAGTRWLMPDDKVKVASTVDGARLAAERKAMQAEAYDTACEART
jgi:hypothetical protein